MKTWAQVAAGSQQQAAKNKVAAPPTHTSCAESVRQPTQPEKIPDQPERIANQTTLPASSASAVPPSSVDISSGRSFTRRLCAATPNPRRTFLKVTVEELERGVKFSWSTNPRHYITDASVEDFIKNSTEEISASSDAEGILHSMENPTHDNVVNGDQAELDEKIVPAPAKIDDEMTKSVCNSIDSGTEVVSETITGHINETDKHDTAAAVGVHEKTDKLSDTDVAPSIAKSDGDGETAQTVVPDHTNKPGDDGLPLSVDKTDMDNKVAESSHANDFNAMDGGNDVPGSTRQVDMDDEVAEYRSVKGHKATESNTDAVMSIAENETDDKDVDHSSVKTSEGLDGSIDTNTLADITDDKNSASGSVAFPDGTVLAEAVGEIPTTSCIGQFGVNESMPNVAVPQVPSIEAQLAALNISLVDGYLVKQGESDKSWAEPIKQTSIVEGNISASTRTMESLGDENKKTATEEKAANQVRDDKAVDSKDIPQDKKLGIETDVADGKAADNNNKPLDDKKADAGKIVIDDGKKAAVNEKAVTERAVGDKKAPEEKEKEVDAAKEVDNKKEVVKGKEAADQSIDKVHVATKEEVNVNAGVVKGKAVDTKGKAVDTKGKAAISDGGPKHALKNIRLVTVFPTVAKTFHKDKPNDKPAGNVRNIQFGDIVYSPDPDRANGSAHPSGLTYEERRKLVEKKVQQALDLRRATELMKELPDGGDVALVFEPVGPGAVNAFNGHREVLVKGSGKLKEKLPPPNKDGSPVSLMMQGWNFDVTKEVFQFMYLNRIDKCEYQANVWDMSTVRYNCEQYILSCEWDCPRQQEYHLNHLTAILNRIRVSLPRPSDRSDRRGLVPIADVEMHEEIFRQGMMELTLLQGYDELLRPARLLMCKIAMEMIPWFKLNGVWYRVHAAWFAMPYQMFPWREMMWHFRSTGELKPRDDWPWMEGTMNKEEIDRGLAFWKVNV